MPNPFDQSKYEDEARDRLRQGDQIDISPKDGKWIATNRDTGEEFEYDPFNGMLPPVSGEQPRVRLRIANIDEKTKTVTFTSEEE